MLYTTDNLQISLTVDLAQFLRTHGYDVLWHESGETDPTTASTRVGTITFIPYVPANPTPFVRLKGESGGPEEIVVPALTVQLYSLPRRRAILGLGHREYSWERDFQVDAFAADVHEQRLLADLLHMWLQRDVEQEIPVSDYRSNPLLPSALEPVRVLLSDTRREELVNENVAVRYYIRTDGTIQYIE